MKEMQFNDLIAFVSDTIFDYITKDTTDAELHNLSLIYEEKANKESLTIPEWPTDYFMGIRDTLKHISDSKTRVCMFYNMLGGNYLSGPYLVDNAFNADALEALIKEYRAGDNINGSLWKYAFIEHLTEIGILKIVEYDNYFLPS